MKSIALLATLVATAVAVPVGPERNAAILKSQNNKQPGGSYDWSFETENGITASESGQPGPDVGQPAVVVQGQFSYTGTDGAPILVTYVAGKNGFEPQGAHFPTPPPIPAGIQRSLEYNAAHAEKIQ